MKHSTNEDHFTQLLLITSNAYIIDLAEGDGEGGAQRQVDRTLDIHREHSLTLAVLKQDGARPWHVRDARLSLNPCGTGDKQWGSL